MKGVEKMGVLDELGRRAVKASQNVADEAKKLAETAKLNDRIKEEKRRADQLYYELGQAYFSEVKEQEYGQSRHKQLIDDIKAAIANIEGLQIEEQNLRGVKRCPQCGQEAGLGAGFCPNCGAALPAPKIPVKEAKRFCVGCGAELAPEAKFCLSCGAKNE